MSRGRKAGCCMVNWEKNWLFGKERFGVQDKSGRSGVWWVSCNEWGQFRWPSKNKSNGQACILCALQCTPSQPGHSRCHQKCAWCWQSLFFVGKTLCLFIWIHQKWLEVQRNMYDGVSRELQQLSDTRWACKHVACCSVMDRLPAILLEEISAENNPQRASCPKRPFPAADPSSWTLVIGGFQDSIKLLPHQRSSTNTPQLNSLTPACSHTPKPTGAPDPL